VTVYDPYALPYTLVLLGVSCGVRQKVCEGRNTRRGAVRSLLPGKQLVPQLREINRGEAPPAARCDAAFKSQQLPHGSTCSARGDEEVASCESCRGFFCVTVFA